MTALLASYNFNFQLGPFIFRIQDDGDEIGARLISDRRVAYLR